MLSNYKKSFYLLSVSALFISLFISTICYAQWEDRSIPGTFEGDNVYAMHLEGDSLFAGTNGSGLFLSTDYGLNWKENNTGLGINDRFVRAIIRNGSYMLIGTDGSGVFKSDDNGENWSASSSGLPSGAVVVRLAALNDNIFAALKGSTIGGLYLSADNGGTWNKCTNGLPAGENDFRGVAILNNIVFAGNDDVGFFKSVDYGAIWTEINSGLVDNYLRCKGAMFPFDADMYAGTKDGVIVTSDYENWTKLDTVGLPDDDVRSLAVNSEYVFIGLDNDGLCSSTNRGDNWTEHPGCGSEVRSIVCCDSGLIVGCENGTVFIDPSIVTGIDKLLDVSPDQYTLMQNYPNPFNPSTNIKFNLEKAGHVTLEIYNVLGEFVSSLVNRQMNTGSFSVNWIADGMPTGIYFYKLVVNDFVEVRKMVYMK